MATHDGVRVGLVTGASRGLGAAIARSLASVGVRVAINYLHSQSSADLLAETIRRDGGEADIFRADVRDAEQVATLVAAVRERFGRIQILVNNATGPQPMRALEDYSWKDFQDQLDFFVKAPVLLMQHTIGPMKDAQWGRVVNIGSEVVEIGSPNFSAYVAAKAAMVGLTRSWAHEFGPSGITVNLVAPGWIPVERHTDTDAQVLADYTAGVPLRRQGVPEDVGDAVGFLVSDAARFITGQCLAVNGGNTF